MYWTRKHVLVCTASHCSQKGANEVIGKLRLDIVRKGLDSEILINNCGTIDLCDIGPNMVVYPDNVILYGVTTKDVPAVVEYLRGGEIPEHLLLSPASGAEVARRDFYHEVVAEGGALEVEKFDAIASTHGYDAAWISEQQRRGFIARKPDSAGVEHISVTSKAKARYGIGSPA